MGFYNSADEYINHLIRMDQRKKMAIGNALQEGINSGFMDITDQFWQDLESEIDTELKHS